MYRPVLSSESFICLTYRLYAAPMKSFTTPWAPDARDRRWKTVEICSTTRKGTILAKEGSENTRQRKCRTVVIPESLPPVVVEFTVDMNSTCGPRCARAVRVSPTGSHSRRCPGAVRGRWQAMSAGHSSGRPQQREATWPSTKRDRL